MAFIAAGVEICHNIYLFAIVKYLNIQQNTEHMKYNFFRVFYCTRALSWRVGGVNISVRAFLPRGHKLSILHFQYGFSLCTKVLKHHLHSHISVTSISFCRGCVLLCAMQFLFAIVFDVTHEIDISPSWYSSLTSNTFTHVLCK